MQTVLNQKPSCLFVRWLGLFIEKKRGGDCYEIQDVFSFFYRCVVFVI